MSEGFSIADMRPRGFKKWLVVLAAAAIVFAVAAVTKKLDERPVNLLASLPLPEENSPLVMISASGGEFPSRIFRLFSDSATVSPGGASPISAIIPALAASDCSIVVTEREEGLSAYGAVSLSREDVSFLASGALPKEWARLFTMPRVTSEDNGVLQVSSLNTPAPLYIDLSGRVAYLADTRSDIDRMRDVRSRAAEGITRKWSLGRGWNGHMLVSDGGVIGSLLAGSDDTAARSAPLSLETAWRSSGASQGDQVVSKEVIWQLQGLENYIDRTFAGNFKKYDWSGKEFFIPSPLIASFGVNLPNPGKDTDKAPAAIKMLSDHLTKMGLKPSEVQNILTGPTVISLGGRTQILWFELPGIAIYLEGRSKTAHKLIDRFWSETFMGASPRPVPGFLSGGVTDLPFMVLAAASGDRAVIGLTAPDVEQDDTVKRLLTGESGGIGWLYVDLPRLGASLAEMPSVNALLYEDEDMPTEERSTEALRESLSELGSLFVVWDSASSGRAYWY
jgi:hypothetical protein